MNPQERFVQFLNRHFPGSAKKLLADFELYLNELYSLNQQINLVSRQMPKEDYWLYHFLDSLLVIKCMDLGTGKALDFGSGGGLPGIPLKLVKPELDMVLLDSIGKKVRCLEQMVSALGLKGCKAVRSRVEDYAKTAPDGKFDFIFCRSVKLEPGFVEPLNSLLKSSGKIVFYKAKQFNDLELLSGLQFWNVGNEFIGARTIVAAPKQNTGDF